MKMDNNVEPPRFADPTPMWKEYLAYGDSAASPRVVDAEPGVRGHARIDATAPLLCRGHWGVLVYGRLAWGWDIGYGCGR